MQTLKIKLEDRGVIPLTGFLGYIQSVDSIAGEITFATGNPEDFKAWCAALTLHNCWFEVVSD